MELRQFPALKEHLEHMLGIKAGIREPLTEHCRGLKEITEDFFILNSQLAEYGIKGMIKNHYLGKGCKFEERDTGMMFRKGNEELHVNLTYSPSSILITVLDLRRK